MAVRQLNEKEIGDAFLYYAGMSHRESYGSFRQFSPGTFIESVLEEEGISYGKIAAQLSIPLENIYVRIQEANGRDATVALRAATTLGWMVRRAQHPLHAPEILKYELTRSREQLMGLQERDKKEAQLLAGQVLDGFLKRRSLAYSAAPIDTRWISGKHPVSPEKLGFILKFLNPLEEERAEVVRLIHLAARPDILARENEAWLEKIISCAAWDYISFPALDDEWLEKRPVPLQAGMLVQDLRTRRGLNQPEFAGLLHVSLALVQKWESGQIAIMQKHEADITRTAKADGWEQARFFATAGRSRIASRKESSLQRKTTASRKKDENFSLNELPRPNALLWEYWIESELELSELSSRTGVSQGALRDWIRGVAIRPSKLGELAQHLSAGADRAMSFILAVRPSLIEYVGETWLRAKITSGEWSAVSLPALDEVWLDAHRPISEQAGLFIEDALERRSRTEKLTQNDLGRHVGLAQSRMSRIISGKETILPEHAIEFARLVALSPAERMRFVRLVERSNAAIREGKALRKTSKTQLGSAVPGDVHPELKPLEKHRRRE